MTTHSDTRRRAVWTTLIAVWLVAVATAGAQQPIPLRRVEGTVVEQDSRRPIAGARVTVTEFEGPSRVTTTDGAGHFAIADLLPREYTLRAASFGYRSATAALDLAPGDTTLVIALDPVPATLEPVIVQTRPSERRRFEEAPTVGESFLTQQTLSAVPAAGETDVLRTVQLLPGVIARNDFSAGYNVRGGEANQNLVLLDGIPIYNPFHLGGLFGTFVDESVRDVQLLAGGFPAEYGGRLSSVLEVSSALEARQGVHGTVEGSLLASSVALGGALPTTRGSWNLAARRTYADLIASAVADRVLPYHFYDLQFHGSHALPMGGIASITAYHGHDMLEGDADRIREVGDTTRIGGGDVEFDWGNSLAGLTLAWPLGGASSRSLALGDSASLLQRVSLSQFGATLDEGGGSRRNDSGIAELRLAGALARHGGRHSTRLGYELARQTVRYREREPQLTATISSLDQRSLATALYLDDTWRTGALLLRYGARAEWQDAARWSGVSPRVAVRWFASPDAALTMAVGRYAQWTHTLLDEDLPLRVFESWILSDSVTPVASAWHVVLGGERWLSPARFVRVEGFVKRYSRMLEANLAEDPLIHGDELLTADGDSYGVDVIVRQLDAGRLGGWVAYSYAVSARAIGDERYAPAQDRRHMLNVVASYRTARRVELGARFGFGTGTPYTPIESELVRRVYDPGGAWGGGAVDVERQPLGGARNGARYPAYHRLDLSISRRLDKGRATVTPYLQIVNAYNRHNVFRYRRDFTTSPATEQAMSQFPILPSIGLKVEF